MKEVQGGRFSEHATWRKAYNCKEKSLEEGNVWAHGTIFQVPQFGAYHQEGFWYCMSVYPPLATIPVGGGGGEHFTGWRRCSPASIL